MADFSTRNPLYPTLNPGALDNFTGGGVSSKDLRKAFQKKLSEGILEDKVEVEHLFFYGTPLSIATSEGHTGIYGDQDEFLRIAKVVRKDCIEALKELRRLASNAKPSKTGKEEGGQKKQEKEMYPHLKTIFDRIEKELASKRRKHTTRHLVLCDTSFPHSSDPVSHDTFNVKPDFLLVDTSSETPPPLELGTRPNWAQCLAFFEVKASEYDGPGRGQRTQHGVTDTLSQGVDYARILLSSRPFQLYVFGIFFCGTKYQIAYFDRRGVILSPEHDLFEDLTSFVHIVVRLIVDMTLVDLGKDPTVELIEPSSTQTQARISQRREQSGSSQVFEFPQFSVKFGPESKLSGPGNQLNQAADLHKRTWTTQGMYIWSSHSYLGRGTSVFQVAQHSQAGKVERHAILKTAWRSAERRSESYIYAKIRAIFLESGQQPEQIEGIPTALMGEDVVVGDPPTSRMLSIHFLRDKDRTPSLCSGLAAKDWILHRVVINDVGKPLWKYSCGEELIRALLAALNGHKALADRGILHRDISPGNILIKLRTEEQAIPLPSTGTVTRAAIARSEAPPILTGIDPQEATGFLTDFEYASLPNDDDWVNPQDIDSIKNAGMSGTAMFMASEVLHLINSSGDHKVQRTVSHDLQSFLWTILYVVFKHTMDSLERTKGPKGFQRQIFEEEYHQMFSAISVKGLIGLRFQRLKSSSSQDVQITPTVSVPEEIEHLMRYLAHTDPILIDLIDTTWNLLASCEPLATERPFRPLPAADLAKTSLYLPKQPSPLRATTAEQPNIVSSQTAQTLHHDALTVMLKGLLTRIDRDRAEGSTQVPEPEGDELDPGSDSESDSEIPKPKPDPVARPDSPLHFGGGVDSDDDDDNAANDDANRGTANDDGRQADDHRDLEGVEDDEDEADEAVKQNQSKVKITAAAKITPKAQAESGSGKRSEEQSTSKGKGAVTATGSGTAGASGGVEIKSKVNSKSKTKGKSERQNKSKK